MSTATDQHRPPMELGEVLDYSDFRSAAKAYIRARAKAVEDYEKQAKVAAEAEAEYQKTKAVVLTNLRATEDTAGEAIAKLKGDDQVAAAAIERDLQAEILRARREDIEGIDEASAHLRKIADWSQRIRGVVAHDEPERRAA